MLVLATILPSIVLAIDHSFQSGILASNDNSIQADADAATPLNTSPVVPVASQPGRSGPGYAAACFFCCFLVLFVSLLMRSSTSFRKSSSQVLSLAGTLLLCAGYIAIAGANDILVKHETQANNGILPFSPSRMVCVVEVGKLVLTLPLALAKWQYGDIAHPSKSDCIRMLGLMLGPASAYSINNALVYFIIAHVDFSSLSVWRQMTPLFVALLWVAIFRRALGMQRWVALCMLIFGTTLNSWSGAGVALPNPVMLTLILLSCFISALSGVANEYALKQFDWVDIDLMCVFLYMQTAAFALLNVLVCEKQFSRMSGGSFASSNDTLLGNTSLIDDPNLMIIIGLQVIWGFSVARVLRHLGAVTRAVVNAMKEVCVLLIAPFFVTSHLSHMVIISALIVGSAVVTFSLGSYEAPLGQARSLLGVKSANDSEP